MLVMTKVATMNTAATLSSAASSAAWISRDSVIATWFRNCASPKAATITTVASHKRRFRTASSKTAFANDATMGMEEDGCRYGCRSLKAGTIRASTRVSPGQGQRKPACHHRYGDRKPASSLAIAHRQMVAGAVSPHAGIAASRRHAGSRGLLGARTDARAFRAVHHVAAVHAGRAAPDSDPGARHHRHCALHPVFPQRVAARPLGERIRGYRRRQGFSVPGALAAPFLPGGAGLSDIAAADLDRAEQLHRGAAAQRGSGACALRVSRAVPR